MTTLKERVSEWNDKQVELDTLFKERYPRLFKLMYIQLAIFAMSVTTATVSLFYPIHALVLLLLVIGPLFPTIYIGSVYDDLEEEKDSMGTEMKETNE